ncbi:MAG: hypothetical protein QOE20_2471 [Mycobacterium sp.]|nr:hypothetical protein [Mycobacterium sp.]
MTRTPEEVFAHHVEALGAGDLDEIVADYSDDAVFITSRGVLRGKEGVRAGFIQLLSDLPNASWALTRSSMVICSSWSGPLIPRQHTLTMASTLLCFATA